MPLRAVCMVGVLTLMAARPMAQAPSVEEVMRRVGDYVHGFVEKFSNVVAEEQFVPDRNLSARASLRSDYLLVRYPGSEENFLTFRDVVEANGVPVGDSKEEMSKLFLQRFENAVEQANAITKHSAQYISAMSDPLLAIAFLQRDYQPRFKYSLGPMDVSLGPGVRRIRFQETRSPTILRRANDRDLATLGTAWVVESSGRVLKTELQIGVGPTVILTTTFKFDQALGIDVPAQMEEFHRQVGIGMRGVATYTRFRRFAVRTEEAIEGPSR